MATKLKSMTYNVGLKVLVVLLLLVMVPVTIYSGIKVLEQENGWLGDTYYDTYQFQTNYLRLMHNVVEKHLILKDEPSIEANYENGDDRRDAINRLRTIEDHLDASIAFKYYLYDPDTNVVYSNLERVGETVMVKWAVPMRIDAYGYEALSSTQYGDYNGQQNLFANYWYNDNNLSSIIRMLEDQGYVLYVAVDEDLLGMDQFFNDYKDYLAFKEYEVYYLALIIIGIMSILAAFIYITFSCGKKYGVEGYVLTAYDHLTFELQMVIVGIGAIPMILIINSGMLEENLYLFLAAIDLLGLSLLFSYQSLVRYIKKGPFWRYFFTLRVVAYFGKKIAGLFNVRRYLPAYKAWVVFILLGGYGLAFILGAMNMGGFQVVLLAIVGFFALRFLLKQLHSLDRLMVAAKAQGFGQLDHEIDVTNLTDDFKEMGMAMNRSKEGMKKAIETSMQQEKMKTELITNVTHDLKNPLTSIITYVELLSKEELENPEARDYITVLQDKSKRLKSLIDQLVDASKASSGTLPINPQELDLVAMVSQMSAEYEQQFADKGLIMVLPEAVTEKRVVCDGAILHRILDNLMSNISKYAMEHTRVYVTYDMIDGAQALTFKNISKDPLNIPVELLSERFVRGDQSRNTEGNGLGLSIAMSLSTAMGAKLLLDIDGDLFKATLICQGH